MYNDNNDNNQENNRQSFYDSIVEEEKPKKKKSLFSINTNKTKTKRPIPTAVLVVFIFILIFWIIPAGLRFVRGFGAWKEYDYMSDKNFMAPPEQSPLPKDEELYETIDIGEYTFKIKKINAYSVSGRVVNVQDYIGYNAFNRFSPRDFGMAWGLYANKKNTKGVVFFGLHDRFLHTHVFDGSKIQDLGGFNKFMLSFSNNHIIPSDKRVRKLMYKVKRDDYIRIDGFLASVYYDNNKQNIAHNSLWTSSTIRNDTGNGACEIILVNNITWLKEP